MAGALDKLKAAFGNLAEPEGLATGAVGAFLFGGPLGIALGIGQGILAKRLRQSEADKAAQEQAMLGQLDKLQADAMAAAQGLAATPLDQAQLAQTNREYEMLRQAANSPDDQTRQSAIVSLAKFGDRQGAWLEDIEGRNETVFDKNVTLLDDQAKLARDEYRAGLDRGQETQRISSEMHTLLADPNFDPNKPLNRARLASLLNQTPRELFADPADMGDAFKELAAGVPVLQNFANYFSGKQKAEDFEFSREDWRKVAHAMTIASKRQSDRMLEDAAAIGQQLDQAATKMQHVPAVSYLDRIVSGKVQGGEAVGGEQSLFQQVIADQAAKEKEQRSTAAKIADVVKPNIEAAKDVVNETIDAGADVIGNIAEETLGLFGIRRRKREQAAQRGATGEWTPRPTN